MAWLDEKFASFIWAHTGTATASQELLQWLLKSTTSALAGGVVMSPAPRRQRQENRGAEVVG